jgi:hypothetical protein
MAVTKSAASTTASIPALDKFLGMTEQFVANLSFGATAAAADSDAREIVMGLCSTVTAQFQEVAVYIKSETAKLGPALKSEAARILRLQGADTLLSSNLLSARQINSTEKVMGLAGIIREVKKILGMLLEILNIKPKWWDKLVNLIDELINLILSLLFPSLAKSLSDAEVSYLQELRAVRRLESADNSRGTRNDDDDR